MVLDFSQNGIQMIFEITDNNMVALKHFSKNAPLSKNKNLKWCNIAEIHICGENPDDHHGGKHTGTSQSTKLKYVSHSCVENKHGNLLEFTLQSDNLKAVVHYQFYTGISAVRAWTTVTNISSVNVGLEYISSFAYTGFDNGIEAPTDNIKVLIPHNSWLREVDWKEYTLAEAGFDKNSAFSTKRIFVYNSGTWSTKEFLPLAVLTNTQSQDVYMWQIENNGSWQWEISDISDMLYFKLSGPTEQENQWYKELAPNESFESVKACVCIGDDFNNTLEQMTKYRRCIFVNPDRKLPVIFNDYMHCINADPTTEKMIPVIDKAAMSGAEYYCMDAGWYADGTWWETVGEWQPCSWRFPGGIKKVFDYIRSKGMIPGIWLEIEVMGIQCPILDEFEDDCFFTRHGKRIIDHGRYQLDFTNEKVREFASSVVDRVVTEYGVGYIKIDYNIDGGIGTECGSDSFGDGLLAHGRAYLDWIDQIRSKYPELVLENCSSGGMRMDYAQLQRHQIQSVSDQTNYRDMAYIAAAAPTAVLPEQSAIWSYPTADDDKNAVIFNMVNSMLQRIHLSGDIISLSDENFNVIKSAIKCYKELRNDILTAIPFYPAGIPEYGDEWICVAFRSSDKVKMALWRLNSENQTITVPIKADKVSVLYPSDHECDAKLTDNGILVSLRQKYSAVILDII